MDAGADPDDVGGAGFDEVNALAADASGRATAAGDSESFEFAGVGGAVSNGGREAFVLSVDRRLTQVVSFRRGDCNDDGGVDISDALCILNRLLLGGTSPGCVAVTNTNGDTEADISDATYLLNHLFLGGSAPAAPFPECDRRTLPTDEEACETPPKNCQQ